MSFISHLGLSVIRLDKQSPKYDQANKLTVLKRATNINNSYLRQIHKYRTLDAHAEAVCVGKTTYGGRPIIMVTLRLHIFLKIQQRYYYIHYNIQKKSSNCSPI